MTQPNPFDLTAVGGTHPGTQSQEEIEGRVSFKIDNDKSISEVGSKIMNAAEWQFTSLSDPNKSPKYAVDPSVSYFGAGALSLIPRVGKFIFAANMNEANRGAFRLDHGESALYSSMNTTTLGSLDIDTVDGQVLNPQSPQQPSTNYSPTKPWIKKLFPTLSSKNLMSIAILELVQFTLLDALDKQREPQPSKNNERKPGVDMATIIVDNQLIEDELLGRA
jgi:hypothetical protein